PDYSQVLPTRTDFEAALSTEQFKAALNRVSVLFTDKYRGVGLKFEPNQLSLFARTTDKDEVEEQMPADYQGNAVEIGFNVSYLLEFLSICKQSGIMMTFSDSN